METNSPAEELPALYRSILDRVAELEAAGDRPQAARLRRDATRAYSGAWDERARRQLERLVRLAERPTTNQRRRDRGLRRTIDAPPRAVIAPDR